MSICVSAEWRPKCQRSSFTTLCSPSSFLSYFSNIYCVLGTDTKLRSGMIQGLDLEKLWDTYLAVVGVGFRSQSRLGASSEAGLLGEIRH